MGAISKALFDKSYINTAEAWGAPDITTDTMKKAIKEWFDLFFRREATKTEDPCQRIPYAVVNKLTKAVFGEYTSDITGGEAGGKLQWMQENLARLDASRQAAVQWTLVGGECYLKPVPQADGFAFSVIRRDHYVVLGRDTNGHVSSVGTAEFSGANGKYYTLLEKRTVDAAGYLTLENKLFESLNKDRLGTKIALTALEKYAALPEVYTYSVPAGIGLVHIKTPMVNCVDGSEDGVSVYEPAVGLIHNINANEKQLADEFELGRMRIAVPADMLQVSGPEGQREIKDKIFVGLDSGVGKTDITVFSPTLRDESFERRKQAYFKACENLISLKRGILSDVEATERTAKEITSSEGDYSLSILDFQRMWFDAVREALMLCDTLGQMYHLCNAEPFEVRDALSISWGNGILYDADSEWAEMMKMVQAEMLKPEIALAWKYDLPWETPQDLAAIREKYMPELAALMHEIA